MSHICPSHICKLQFEIYKVVPMMIQCNQNHAYPRPAAVLAVLTENKTRKISTAWTWVFKINYLFLPTLQDICIYSLLVTNTPTALMSLLACLQVSEGLDRLDHHLGWQSSWSPVISTYNTDPPNLQHVGNMLPVAKTYVTMETCEIRKCL